MFVWLGMTLLVLFDNPKLYGLLGTSLHLTPLRADKMMEDRVPAALMMARADKVPGTPEAERVEDIAEMNFKAVMELVDRFGLDKTKEMIRLSYCGRFAFIKPLNLPPREHFGVDAEFASETDLAAFNEAGGRKYANCCLHGVLTSDIM